MFWLLPRLMIITETESYFLNSNPAGHCLDWQPLFRPSIKRFFLRPLLTAVYLAYIPISLLLRNKRLMCLFPVKTRRLFGADVHHYITKQDSALFGLFKSYFTQGLFSWRNEDPNTRKIAEIGSSQRHMFFLNSVYSQRIILVPSTRKTLYKDFPS